MSDSMSDKEIARFFDNLKPEDFERETSAVETTTIDPPQRGAAAFRRWVDALLASVRESFDTRQFKEWDPAAVLQAPDQRRTFEADDDETNEMFMWRLHREAEKIDAQWFFIATVGPIGVWTDLDDMETNPDRSVQGIMWYTENRDPDCPVIRQGFLSIVDDGDRAGINHEGDPSGAAPMFRTVLANRTPR